MVANNPAAMAAVNGRIGTYDEYLGLAQQILESSWNPNNYKHPAGMDEFQLGVNEAVDLLTSKGFQVTCIVGESKLTWNPTKLTWNPTSPSDASTPPQPGVGEAPPASS